MTYLAACLYLFSLTSWSARPDLRKIDETMIGFIYEDGLLNKSRRHLLCDFQFPPTPTSAVHFRIKVRVTSRMLTVNRRTNGGHHDNRL